MSLLLIRVSLSTAIYCEAIALGVVSLFASSKNVVFSNTSIITLGVDFMLLFTTLLSIATYCAASALGVISLLLTSTQTVIFFYTSKTPGIVSMTLGVTSLLRYTILLSIAIY